MYFKNIFINLYKFLHFYENGMFDYCMYSLEFLSTLHKPTSTYISIYILQFNSTSFLKNLIKNRENRFFMLYFSF